MRKHILVLLTLSLVAGSGYAMAEEPKDRGPEVVRLKMKDLELPFQHWKHQKGLNDECFHCHSKTLGKIENWGRDTAHNLCISCHELEDKGPVYCRECHKKKKSKKK
jgi:hypothetical protein